ncbi:protein-glutamine gamma-glutamyltransferase [Paenibacillus protaetiae]|uniref:protein-glutamine gamma-glutamyltransferase n=1 Tax=Paenibacillus protaetiae TaxID=2509456 RepID=UPI001FC9ED2C|nr:protein-glutamine gamma-glutamyltransferase [Paenibacillus protaetiae]
MIQIIGVDAEQINKLPLTDMQRAIVRQRQNSPRIYRFSSLDALLFELAMRENIVQAAKALYNGDAGFAVFDRSRCNERLWERTPNGGFQLRPGVRPSDGINDIFENGRMYAFECATAMVLILYKAVLETIGKEKFDTYFPDLYVRDWHYDSDLQLVTAYDNNEATYGDVLYFKNPDHNPETPEWQGENAIMIGNDLYFGHGIGIRTGEEMIASLNRKRVPFSMQSAYLTDQVNHPSFEHLRNIAARGTEPMLAYLQGDVIARVGSHGYSHYFLPTA